MPGVESLETLIDKNLVLKVKSPEELIDKMNFTPNEYSKDFFFKAFDEEIFKKIIK